MTEYILKNEFQEITILNYGATIHKWIAFKEKRNIVISNQNLNDYLIPENGYFSATIGRVANRIRDGKFTLNGINYQLNKNFENNMHHGHGGPNGFYKQKFELVSYTNTKLVLKYFSKHLEENYPGNLTLYVTYTLNNHKLIVNYLATTDEDTIINITNHAHFNLSDEPTILNHSLYIPANHYIKTDSNLVPTGEVLPVKNTLLDFNQERILKESVLYYVKNSHARGLDHSLIANDYAISHLKYQDKNLIVTSTYPVIQVYSMNNPIKQPLLNRKFHYHMGIAFEHQYESDAINHPNFHSIILKKDDEYNETITYEVFEK